MSRCFLQNIRWFSSYLFFENRDTVSDILCPLLDVATAGGKKTSLHTAILELTFEFLNNSGLF